jgi:hypothetical protein
MIELHKTIKEETNFLTKLKIHKTPASARKRNLEVSRSVVAIKRDLLSGSLQREISREREIKGSFYDSTAAA